MDERMTQLETTIAYHEDLVEKLNSVITEQQRVLDELTKKVDLMIKTNAFSKENDIRDISQEVPPPHY